MAKIPFNVMTVSRFGAVEVHHIRAGSAQEATEWVMHFPGTVAVAVNRVAKYHGNLVSSVESLVHYQQAAEEKYRKWCEENQVTYHPSEIKY